MSVIVQKYGGTSVRDLDHIYGVAKRVMETKNKGYDIVVVLSAMAGETDRLLGLGHETALDPNKRELDVLLATGEQKTASLMALVLDMWGEKSRSLLGSQIRILTDDAYGNARIWKVENGLIKDLLNDGHIVICAGFQGIAPNGDITTLGRGGSDTTAVALAAALRADRCEIYTDVDGVYSADPNVCSGAKLAQRLSYDEMLEMSRLGAKVLHVRSVWLARKYKVPLHVRHAKKKKEGTMILNDENIMESPVVSGVISDPNLASITIRNVPDKPGYAAAILNPIANAGIVIDMIIQNKGKRNGDDITDFSFTVSAGDLEKCLSIVEEVTSGISGSEFIYDSEIVKISIIGNGIQNHPGVAAAMFSVTDERDINIMMISTSEIRISIIIEKKYEETIVKALHDLFFP